MGLEPESRALSDRRVRNHPAYETLVDGFGASTSAPEHLAFLTLQTLRAAGFSVLKLGNQEATRTR